MLGVSVAASDPPGTMTSSCTPRLWACAGIVANGATPSRTDRRRSARDTSGCVLEAVTEAQEKPSRLAGVRHRLGDVKTYAAEVETGADVRTECGESREVVARIRQRSVGHAHEPSAPRVGEYLPCAVAVELMR